MSIDINSLNFRTQLVQVNELLSEARAENTYLKGRMVTFKGGSMSLDALVKKVTAVSQEGTVIAHLTPASMVAGVEITRTLKQFYFDTDQSAGTIIKLLNWLREFSLFFPATRLTLDEDKFLSFSQSRFFLYLGADWPLQEHPARDVYFWSRTVIKEEWIRVIAANSASDNLQLIENLKLARQILLTYSDLNFPLHKIRVHWWNDLFTRFKKQGFKIH